MDTIFRFNIEVRAVCDKVTGIEEPLKNNLVEAVRGFMSDNFCISKASSNNLQVELVDIISTKPLVENKGEVDKPNYWVSPSPILDEYDTDAPFIVMANKVYLFVQHLISVNFDFSVGDIKVAVTENGSCHIVSDTTEDILTQLNRNKWAGVYDIHVNHNDNSIFWTRLY